MIDWLRRLFAEVKSEIDPPPVRDPDAPPDIEVPVDISLPPMHPFLIHRARCRQCRGFDPCTIGRELLK
jgi:hypothetical protein